MHKIISLFIFLMISTTHAIIIDTKGRLSIHKIIPTIDETNQSITIKGSGFTKNTKAIITALDSEQEELIVSNLNTNAIAEQILIKGSYAYIANHYKGLTIIDISNKNAPNILSTTSTKGTPYSLDINDQYIYIADGYNGLSIIDIKSSKSPKLVSNIRLYDFASYVTIVDNYAYVSDRYKGLTIVDISDKVSPKITSNIKTDGSTSSIVIDANYAYISDNNNGVTIIDISNVQLPKIVSNIYFKDYVSSTTIDNQYLYVSSHSYNSSDTNLTIMNINSPTTPVYISSIKIKGYIKSVKIYENNMIVASREGGLNIFNISDKNNITLIHNISSLGTVNDISLSNDSKHLYLSMNNSDFTIIDNPIYNRPKVELKSSNEIEITLFNSKASGIFTIRLYEDNKNYIKALYGANVDLTVKDRGILKLKKGWNLCALPVTVDLDERLFKTLFFNFTDLYTYDNDYIEKYKIKGLKVGDGFWVKSTNDKEINFHAKTSNPKFNINDLNPKTSGWSLLGTSANVSSLEIINKFKPKVIWLYKNSTWYSITPNDNEQAINAGDGFWMLK